MRPIPRVLVYRLDDIFTKTATLDSISIFGSTLRACVRRANLFRAASLFPSGNLDGSYFLLLHFRCLSLSLSLSLWYRFIADAEINGLL